MWPLWAAPGLRILTHRLSSFSRPAPRSKARSAAKADWYPDPRGEKRLRYWDGSQWTDHTAD